MANKNKLWIAIIFTLVLAISSLIFNQNYIKATTEVSVLAVKQDSFSSADIPNFRLYGSTRLIGSQISLVQNQESQAGSFFTSQKIYMPDAENAGFSTYFEMSTSGGSGLGFGDGFTFIVSQYTNVLGSSGGAIGYGGISNSVAVIFDSWENGGDYPFSVSLGLNGGKASASTRFTTNYEGSQKWRVWIDYSKNAQKMEVRMSQWTDIRPANPFVTYNNLDLSSHIGNEFYTGFTSSTGGAYQNSLLGKWYFSATFNVAGIDPSGNYVANYQQPLKPVLSPTFYNTDLGGWQFDATPNPNETMENVQYLYQVDSYERQVYTPESVIPDGARSVKLFAVSDTGYISSEYDLLTMNRALFYMNYDNVSTQAMWYPNNANSNLYTPTRLGYTFLGWTKTIDYNEESIYTDYTFTSDQLFVAHWELKPFEISFDTNGGNPLDPIESDIISGFILPPNPTKLHYQFAGWYEDPLLLNPFDENNYNYLDVTLYAKWEAEEIPLIYHSFTLETTNLLHYGDPIIETALTNLDNYFFDGYYQDANYAMPFVFNEPILNETHIYLKWVDAIPVRTLIENMDNFQLPIETGYYWINSLFEMRMLYDSLSQDQLKFLNPNYLTQLTIYESILEDLLIAESVTASIDDLPWIPSLDDETRVQEVLMSYEQLTTTQKTYISEQSLHKLNDVQNQVNRLNQASIIETMILSWNPNNLNDYFNQIQSTYLAYIELTDLAKALVDPDLRTQLLNQSDLMESMQLVIDLVNEIVTTNSPSLDQINDWLNQVDSLNDFEKTIWPLNVQEQLLILVKNETDHKNAREFTLLVDELPTNYDSVSQEVIDNILLKYSELSLTQQSLLSDETIEIMNQLIALNEQNPNPEDSDSNLYVPWLSFIISGVMITLGYFYIKKKN